MIFVVHCNVITSRALMGYNCSTCITSINSAELIRRKGIVKPLIAKGCHLLQVDFIVETSLTSTLGYLVCMNLLIVFFYFNILPYVHLEKDWGLFNNSLPVPNVTEISYESIASYDVYLNVMRHGYNTSSHVENVSCVIILYKF